MARQPRWYFDADTIGLGKLVAPARRDVTWPGDTGERTKERLRQEPSPITAADTADELWIPRVTAAGMAIITRDKHIQSRTSEIDAVMASGARMFAITSTENLDRWGLLEVFFTRWRDIEAAAAEPGPYVYAVTRSQIRRLLPDVED